MSLINYFFGVDKGREVREANYHPANEPPTWLGHLGNDVHGVTVTKEKVEALASVHGCISHLQRGIGMMPLRVFGKDSNGNRVKAKTHPLYKLLKYKPNGISNVQSWLEGIAYELAVCGNSFHKIVRAGNQKVIAIEPLDPRLVQVKKTKQGTLVYVFKDKFIFTNQEVLHFKWVSKDGIMGSSPIDVCRNLFAGAIAGENYDVSTFANNANPTGILKIAGTLDDDQAKRLKDDWDELYGRGEESGRGGTAVLEEGADWSPISITPADAEFLQTMKFKQSTIAGIFGVPPHMLGNMDGAKYDNLEAQGTNFVRYGLLHIMKRIELTLDCTILQAETSGKDNFCKFNPNILMRASTKDRYETHRIGIEAGFLTRNEARQLEDWNPKGGADELIQPLNMGTVDSEGGEPESSESEDSETKSKDVFKPIYDDCIERINKKFDAKHRQLAKNSKDIESEKIAFIELKMKPFTSEVLSPLAQARNLQDNELQELVDEVCESLRIREL